MNESAEDDSRHQAAIEDAEAYIELPGHRWTRATKARVRELVFRLPADARGRLLTSGIRFVALPEGPAFAWRVRHGLAPMTPLVLLRDKELPADALEAYAVIAHELGHAFDYADRPDETREIEQEKAADNYAVAWGFKAGLLSTLERENPDLTDGQRKMIDTRLQVLRSAP